MIINFKKFDVINARFSGWICLGTFVYSCFSRIIIWDALITSILAIMIMWNSLVFIKRILTHNLRNEYIEEWQEARELSKSVSCNPILIIFIYGFFINTGTLYYYFGLVFVTLTSLIQLVYYYRLEKTWVLPWLFGSFFIMTNLWSVKLGTKDEGMFERQQYVIPVDLTVLKDAELKKIYLERYKETYNVDDSMLEDIPGVHLQTLNEAELLRFYIRNHKLDGSIRNTEAKNSGQDELNSIVQKEIDFRLKIRELVKDKGIKAKCSVLVQHKFIPLSSYILDPLFLGLFIDDYSNQNEKVTFLTLKVPDQGIAYQLDTTYNKFNYKYESLVRNEAFFRIMTTNGLQYVGHYSSVTIRENGKYRYFQRY
jgi:hypothetical protein